MHITLSPHELKALRAAEASTGVRMLTVDHVPGWFGDVAQHRPTRAGQLYLFGLDMDCEHGWGDCYVCTPDETDCTRTGDCKHDQGVEEHDDGAEACVMCGQTMRYAR